MPQKPDDILKKLKNGDYAPVYFLFGDEPYFIDLITDYIADNALAESEKGFNQMVLYGKDLGVSDVINHARRFPMMAERQVVIIKEAQGITDMNRNESEEMLSAYVSNPLPSTILVLAYKNKKPDKRKTLYKNLEKHAVTVESNKLYDNQLPDWISDYIKTRGHDVDIKATYMLAEFIGNNLERLSNEIDKILINYSEPVEINAGIVQKYIGISKDYNSFELQKAIAVRDIVKANRIVNYFGANPKNNPVIPIIALLFNFFSKLIVIHSSREKNPKTLAQLTGVHPFFIKEYIHASGHYPLAKVIQNIHYIRAADLKSKGVGVINMKESEILKELVYHLLH